MADTAQEPQLKYLGFFNHIFRVATAYVQKVYTYAKDSSGPLKPSADTVEGTVKTVVGPVYEKIEGKPKELLQYLDNKVDETLNLVENLVPDFVKQKTYQAYDVAKQAPEAARSLVADVQKQGISETANEFYQKYEPVAEEWACSAWQQFLKLPLAPQAVHLAAPAALFGAHQYNQFVSALKHHQLPLSDYIPLLPVEKIEQSLKSTPAPAESTPSQEATSAPESTPTTESAPGSDTASTSAPESDPGSTPASESTASTETTPDTAPAQ